MAIIIQRKLFGWEEIKLLGDLERLKLVLETLPDEELMDKLETERKGKRDDYPIRAIWNSVIAGVVYQHKSIESLRRELLRNGQLRELCGFDVCAGIKGVPTSWAYTRFLKKLIRHRKEIENMFNKLVINLTKLLPDLGEHLVVDSKELHSYSKGKKEGGSDPDADWGKKTKKKKDKSGKIWEEIKKWFGYKIHIVGDSKYELPLGYKITRASKNDSENLLPLVENIKEKHSEIIERAKELSGDRGYDSEENNKVLLDKYGIKPIIDIRDMWKSEKGDRKKEEKVTRPLYENKVDNIVYDYRGTVYCDCFSIKKRELRELAYCGYEKDRGTLKYRCPSGAYGVECTGKAECGHGRYGEYGRVVRIPIEKDRRVFVPLPRGTYAFKKAYRRRTSVERINGRLDNDFCFEQHYIRGKAKMEVRIGLAMIVMLALAIGRIKQKQPELMRSLVKLPQAA